MGNQEELLQPGDFVAYSADKKAIVKREKAIPPEIHTSWKDGVLILKDQSVKHILQKIEEIYGVQIKVLDQSLLTNIKTISVPMDKLEIAVPVLERTFGVKITKQANQLVIQ
jgi:ferric-dicitrate binding protein FerR (iron transport regulator)